MSQENTEAEAVDERIRTLVCEELEIEPDELDDDADFAEAYDADSLSLITVAARIEKELRVAIPESEWSTLTTLREVLATVHRYAEKDRSHV